jgi:hypothetical protein
MEAEGTTTTRGQRPGQRLAAVETGGRTVVACVINAVVGTVRRAGAGLTAAAAREGAARPQLMMDMVRK